jgi:methylsterol monooxygenase
MNEIWKSMAKEYFGDNEMVMFIVMVVLAFEVPFWLFNGLLIVIQSEYMTWFDRFRIQSDKPRVNWTHQPDLIKKLVGQTLSHQVSLILFSPILYYVLNFGGKVDIVTDIPDATTVIVSILLFTIAEDALFFWIHYALHHPVLFKYIHSKHHEYKQPVGVVSVLGHPLEGLIGNQIPVFLLPALLPHKHLFTICVWIVLRVYQTVNAHSGYDLPILNPKYWLPWIHGGAEMHDHHHRHGSFFTFWDRLLGTYKN